jgi:hypothetical protein
MPWLSRVAEGEEGDRCLPACTKRRPEVGREVRRERRVRRLVCVIAVGTMRGIAGGVLAGIERNGERVMGGRTVAVDVLDKDLHGLAWLWGGRGGAGWGNHYAGLDGEELVCDV